MPKRKDQDGIYKRADSPYYWASYINASGKRTRRSTGTDNKKEAEALLSKWKLESYRGKHWEEQPSRLFDELMISYLRETEGRKKAPVRDKCSLKHLYPVFSGRDMHAISTQEIRGYISLRRQQGAAASTINKEVGLFSSAINYANREWGWNIPNPARHCKQKEPEGIVRWLTKEEAALLVREAGRDPRTPHLSDFITLALHTGCRKGELLNLEWRRVNMKARLILLEGVHTKAGKRRSVPINQAAHNALMQRLRFRAQHCPRSPWVFCHKDGTRVQDVHTKGGFETACRRARITDFRVHDLRHTCAAWLVTAGVPLAEVRELLGHHTIGMTERYAHLAPENIRAAVARLDEESRSSHVLEIVGGKEQASH
jgi:integrase